MIRTRTRGSKFAKIKNTVSSASLEKIVHQLCERSDGVLAVCHYRSDLPVRRAQICSERPEGFRMFAIQTLKLMFCPHKALKKGIIGQEKSLDTAFVFLNFFLRLLKIIPVSLDLVYQPNEGTGINTSMVCRDRLQLRL